MRVRDVYTRFFGWLQVHFSWGWFIAVELFLGGLLVALIFLLWEVWSVWLWFLGVILPISVALTIALVKLGGVPVPTLGFPSLGPIPSIGFSFAWPGFGTGPGRAFWRKFREELSKRFTTKIPAGYRWQFFLGLGFLVLMWITVWFALEPLWLDLLGRLVHFLGGVKDWFVLKFDIDWDAVLGKAWEVVVWLATFGGRFSAKKVVPGLFISAYIIYLIWPRKHPLTFRRPAPTQITIPIPRVLGIIALVDLLAFPVSALVTVNWLSTKVQAPFNFVGVVWLLIAAGLVHTFWTKVWSLPRPVGLLADVPLSWLRYLLPNFRSEIKKGTGYFRGVRFLFWGGYDSGPITALIEFDFVDNPNNLAELLGIVTVRARTAGGEQVWEIPARYCVAEDGSVGGEALVRNLNWLRIAMV